MKNTSLLSKELHLFYEEVNEKRDISNDMRVQRDKI